MLGPAAAALTVFPIMLSDFFDTVGTVVAVGQEAHYLDDRGNFPRPGAVLLIDSFAAAAGGAAGARSATTYIESASGAAAGGRTGTSSSAASQPGNLGGSRTSQFRARALQFCTRDCVCRGGSEIPAEN